jgi:NB-ARC domain
MAEAQDDRARQILNQLSTDHGARLRQRFPSITAWREEVGTRSSEQHSEPAVPQPAAAETMPAIWAAVPLRNKNFTGREDILHQLRLGRTPGTASLPVALLGMGGVGKTALATEHAHRFASHYDVIWWIAADQPALVRSSLATLAELLGLESATTSGIEAAASAALNALRRGEPFSRWLLIFDHADQPEELNDMIPRGPGDVLITSRNSRWEVVVDTITVDAFNREESRAFLPRRLPRGLAEGTVISTALSHFRW